MAKALDANKVPDLAWFRHGSRATVVPLVRAARELGEHTEQAPRDPGYDWEQLLARRDQGAL